MSFLKVCTAFSFVIGFGGLGQMLPGLAVQEGATSGWPLVLLALGLIASFRLTRFPGWLRFAVAGALIGSLTYSPLAAVWSSPKSLYSDLESIAEHLEVDAGLGLLERQRWEEAGSLYEALVAVGAELPDLSGLAARVSKRIEEGGSVDFVVCEEAQVMGLLTEEGLLALAATESSAIGELKRSIELQANGKDPARRGYLWDDEGLVRLLLATEEIDERSRAALIELLKSHWPSKEVYFAHKEALSCIRLLELLEADEVVASLRGPTREMLSRRWMKPHGITWLNDAGGFMDSPGRRYETRKCRTLAGVELMARFGIPDGVDPFLLRGFLVRESEASWIFPPSKHTSAAKGRAALLRLDQQIGMPQRSWLAWLWAKRHFALIAAFFALLGWADSRHVRRLESASEDGLEGDLQLQS